MALAPHAPWHALAKEEVTEHLGTSPRGLSSDDATARLCRFWSNQLKAAPPVPLLKLFFDEFRSPLILILMASALLLFMVAVIGSSPEHNVDAGLILAIVLINGILGFVQNSRAHRGIEALKRLSAPISTFLPDGRWGSFLGSFSWSDWWLATLRLSGFPIS